MATEQQVKHRNEQIQWLKTSLHENGWHNTNWHNMATELGCKLGYVIVNVYITIKFSNLQKW